MVGVFVVFRRVQFLPVRNLVLPMSNPVAAIAYEKTV